LAEIVHDVRLFEFPRFRFRMNALLNGAVRNRSLQVGYYQFADVARYVRGIQDQYDAVFCFHVRMTEYARGVAGATFVDLVDAISMNYERALRQGIGGAWRAIYRFERDRLREYERRMINSFDRSFVISEVDRTYLIEAGSNPDRLAVLPNGTDEAPNIAPADEDIDFAFLGNMETQSNRSAAEYFAASVFQPLIQRRPGLTYYIVGTNPPRSLRALDDGRAIVVTGLVPKPSEYLARAKVVVAPMLFAAGVQNKILEAMALGKPVLTTTVGAEGLSVVHGTHCVIADDAASMQEESLRLIDDPSYRRRIGEAGRDLVRRLYQWGPVGTLLHRHVDEVLALRRR
jgi:glycosyltransferase involved in cell wall biosynthesis